MFSITRNNIPISVFVIIAVQDRGSRSTDSCVHQRLPHPAQSAQLEHQKWDKV